MRFAAQEYFYWLLLIPLVAAGGIAALVRRRRASQKVADAPLLMRLAAEASLEREILRLTLIVLSLTALVVALARPHPRLSKYRKFMIW